MITTEYQDKDIMYIPTCFVCGTPFAHYFKTTLYCVDCESNHSADNDRAKRLAALNKLRGL